MKVNVSALKRENEKLKSEIGKTRAEILDYRQFCSGVFDASVRTYSSGGVCSKWLTQRLATIFREHGMPVIPWEKK